ncbi:uncharacterized protein MAM_00870 [Metarhizium album ARSEF 1941]|uniref:Uncharacterized protein n=1 Tax=Metarhizium album (strain ARSEF 1941) TaxID=1081103 RepID=A0A0B2X662_METAS|nr:uncharacterized protein MAM_00870 [Metarhizium album ARSEF 1941]KHO01869.1 hypothetical protein MAM_00870 [Metarhizium album ARSEF 1941]
MRFSVVSAVIASVGLVAAAPAREANMGGLNAICGFGFCNSGPGKGAADAAQGVGAEAFKAGDVLLNLLGDGLGSAASGNVLGAATGVGQNAATVVGQVPGDFTKIGTAAGAGVMPATTKTN